MLPCSAAQYTPKLHRQPDPLGPSFESRVRSTWSGLNEPETDENLVELDYLTYI